MLVSKIYVLKYLEVYKGDLVSKSLPEGSASGQPYNIFMQPIHHRMPDDVDNGYFWGDKTHCLLTYLRAFLHEPNFQVFNEPSIVLNFMYRA